MTPRERLLTTLRGQIADRVPVAPFVQDEYLAFYYPHKKTVDRVIDAMELANELDFDLMAKHRAFEQPHFFKRSYRNWKLRRTESRAAGMIQRRLEITTKALPTCGPIHLVIERSSATQPADQSRRRSSSSA